MPKRKRKKRELPPLTQHELNHMHCDNPECVTKHNDQEPFVFHSRCHPAAATWTWYLPETGTLRVLCAECDQEVATVLVSATLEPHGHFVEETEAVGAWFDADKTMSALPPDELETHVKYVGRCVKAMVWGYVIELEDEKKAEAAAKAAERKQAIANAATKKATVQ